MKSTKIYVKSRFDKPIVKAAPFGDVVEPDIRLERDSNGNCIYKKHGEKNISNYIESFKNGCSLKAILDRCQLMPIHDKIAYLNQTENGVNADITNLPKDGTEAQIMLQRYKRENPEIAKRIAAGESFDKIIADMTKNKISADSATNDKKESEVINNGKNESSNE